MQYNKYPTDGTKKVIKNQLQYDSTHTRDQREEEVECNVCVDSALAYVIFCMHFSLFYMADHIGLAWNINTSIHLESGQKTSHDS